MKIELAANERVIREGGANVQRRWEAVGGRLFLTNARLVFSSHSFNVQTGPLEIPLADIREITPCWTKFMGLIPLAPNSLAVRSDSGEHRFVVHGRRAWAAAIHAAQAAIPRS